MSNALAPYRSKCRIYADILRAVQNNGQAKAAYLMHTANLSHERLMSHLTKMTDLGLIERKMDGELVFFSITQRGRVFLMEFRKVEEFGNAFGVEI
jgi:predicted transcriptional regulator